MLAKAFRRSNDAENAAAVRSRNIRKAGFVMFIDLVGARVFWGVLVHKRRERTGGGLRKIMSAESFPDESILVKGSFLFPRF